MLRHEQRLSACPDAPVAHVTTYRRLRLLTVHPSYPCQGQPGATALTVMDREANSRAKLFVNPIRPAFEAA